MGLFDRFLGWVERAARTLRTRKGSSKGERTMASLMPGAGFGWPGGWSAARWEQVQHWKGWTYVAGKKRAETIAGLCPIVATVTKAEGRRNDLRTYAQRQLRRKWLTPLADEEDLSPVPLDHPLRLLLQNPNGPDVAWTFWYKLSMNLDLTGNGYVWCVPDGADLPAELWVLPSQWVYPVVLGKGRQLVDYYELRPFGTSGGRGALRLPPDEVIHFAEPHPYNLIDGYAALQGCAEWFDSDEAVTRSQWAAFVNQSVPGLHIELGPEYVDPDEATLERIRKRIDEKFQGTLKTGQTIITPPGAKLQGYTNTPTEMAYLESADQTRDKCLAAYGTPKEVVGQQPSGNELSWYAPMLQFCRFTIKPRLEWFGQVLTEKLAWRYDESLRVYWNDPTPDNPQQVNADLQADFAAGTITPNEWRAVRGREPYQKGGDDPLVPSSLSPLKINTGKEPEEYEVPVLEALKAQQQAEQAEAEQQMQKEQMAAAAQNGDGMPGQSGNGKHPEEQTGDAGPPGAPKRFSSRAGGPSSGPPAYPPGNGKGRKRR